MRWRWMIPALALGAALVHRHDGVTWAVLFNSTDDTENPPYDLVDERMHEVINGVKDRPRGE